MSSMLIIQILTPLLGGISCLLIDKRFTWAFASIVSLINFLMSIFLLKFALSFEPVYYHVGDWGREIGIEYKLDKLNSFFIFLVNFFNLVNIVALRSYFEKEVDSLKTPFFFALLLLATTGFIGIAISNDIFNIYVLLEVSSISSYALVAAQKSKESKKAGFDYLVFGTIGSTFILFGIGFIYSLVGSLNLSIIATQAQNIVEYRSGLAAIILILFGILMKVGLFPLSKWLVDIYQNSPSFIASFLSSCSNKVGIYLLIKFYFEVFKLNRFNFEYLTIILLSTAIFAIFSCSILAMKQTNIKRFLAYSSLSQIGLITLAVALSSKTSLSGTIIYCLSHSLEKVSLFLAAGLLPSLYFKTFEFSSLKGLVREHKWLGIILIINLLSTIGFPLTFGFVGKWEIFKASLASDIWYIMIVAVAVIFTITYVFKFIEVIIFHENESNQISLSTNKSFCLWILTILAGLNLLLGVKHQFIINFAQQLAESILK